MLSIALSARALAAARAVDPDVSTAAIRAAVEAALAHRLRELPSGPRPDAGSPAPGHAPGHG